MIYMILFSNFLIIFSAINIDKATIMIKIQSITGILVVLNIGCSIGVYIANNCNINDAVTANTNVLLIFPLFALQLNTLNN